MDDLEYHFLEEVRAGRMSRRDFLVRASVLGLSVPDDFRTLAPCCDFAKWPLRSHGEGLDY